MNRVSRTAESLTADLSPPSWRARTLGCAAFSLAQLAVSLALLVHGRHYHWRCDDPVVVGMVFFATGLCMLWTLAEHRRHERLLLDRQSLQLKRGWAFGTRVALPLDEISLEDAPRALLVEHRGKVLRLGTQITRAERAVLHGAMKSHLSTHTIRLR